MRKRFISAILLMMVMNLLFVTLAFAQEAAPAAPAPAKGGVIENIASVIFGSGMVKWFKDGGWAMWPILFVTLYALSYVIWKFITLTYGKIRLNDFLDKVMPLVKSKKYKEAAEIAKATRGPVAAIIYAGLLKAGQGVDAFEKAVENAAMIEMSYLEKGFTEMSAGITLAPMLGFLGTVAGMITAFDAIAAARAVDATIVASGIKIALITTEAGLIVAIPTQFFNNLFVTWVDGLVIDMQRASEKVTEALVETA
jgi:biopolymer transport protein ExbB